MAKWPKMAKMAKKMAKKKKRPDKNKYQQVGKAARILIKHILDSKEIKTYA